MHGHLYYIELPLHDKWENKRVVKSFPIRLAHEVLYDFLQSDPEKLSLNSVDEADCLVNNFREHPITRRHGRWHASVIPRRLNSLPSSHPSPNAQLGGRWLLCLLPASSCLLVDTIFTQCGCNARVALT